MKTKIYSIFAVAIVVGIGYVISNPLVFHICSNVYQFGKDIGCSDDIVKNVGNPLFIFSPWILLTVIVAAFFSDGIFKSWFYFALWTIPLAVVFIVATHVSTNAYIDFFPFYRDDAARLVGEVFAGVSLTLVIWKWFSSCRSGKV